MHLLPTNGYGRAFVSHDEWVAFASDANNPQLVPTLLRASKAAQCRRRDLHEGRHPDLASRQ
jgi:hypothetical protein